MITQELFTECVNKDPKAWDKLISQAKGVVLRSINYKLKNMGISVSKYEVEDIAQDLFLMLWEKDKLRSVTKPETLAGWLAIVSINFTANYCRKRKDINNKNIVSFDNYLFDNDHESSMENIIPSKEDISLEIEKNDYHNIIEEEISKLNHKHQLIIKFNLFDGKGQKDIAELMKIPEGTVAAVLKRVKDTLRKKLAKKS